MNALEDDTKNDVLIDANDEIIDRPTSAPPQLGVINGNMYGMVDEMKYLNHDVRMHPSYENFYNSNVDKDPSLPMPISYLTNWFGDTHISNSTNYDLFNTDQMNFSHYNQNFLPSQYSMQSNVNSYVQPNQSEMYQNYDDRSTYDHFYSPQSQTSHDQNFNGQGLSRNSNQQSPQQMSVIQSFKNLHLTPKKSPKNKSLGKVVINSDINLSDSTEDLLSLAGQTHLKVNNQLDMTNASMNELPIVMLNTLSNGSNKTPSKELFYQNDTYSMSKFDSNQIPIPPEKTVLCRYYSQGHCNKGDKCMYIHSTDSLPEETSPTRKTTSTPTKFTGLKIEDCSGKIYAMSKDQHGCRFLQKSSMKIVLIKHVR